MIKFTKRFLVVPVVAAILAAIGAVSSSILGAAALAFVVVLVHDIFEFKLWRGPVFGRFLHSGSIATAWGVVVLGKTLTLIALAAVLLGTGLVAINSPWLVGAAWLAVWFGLNKSELGTMSLMLSMR